MQSDNAPFSLPDSQGVWRGMDVDSCRALAAAVLGDPNKATIRPVTGMTRFPAIQGGEIDVLFGSTTWITTRETSLGLVFAATNFFSGQGFLVKRSLRCEPSDRAERRLGLRAPGLDHGGDPAGVVPRPRAEASAPS